jgi:hypothetical protein
MVYSEVFCLKCTRFLGIRGWRRGVQGLRFLFQFGGPVNFQMCSANVLWIAKFQVDLLYSCSVERINPIRGAD